MNIYALIANVLRIVKTHFFACRMVNLSFIETRGAGLMKVAKAARFPYISDICVSVLKDIKTICALTNNGLIS